MKIYQRVMSGVLLVMAAVPCALGQGLEFDSSRIIFHYRGTHNGYYNIGMEITTLGDVNGDGFDDIAFASGDPYGTLVFFGNNVPDTTPDMFILGGKAAPIDLDGDGIDDLVTAAEYTVDYHPFGVLYFFKGYGDSLASQPYDSLRRDSANYGFGMGIRTGYADSDLLGDLLVLQPNTLGGPTVYYYSGCPALDTIPEWSWKIDGYSHSLPYPYPLGFVDFDGDSIQDVFLGLKYDKDPDSISVVNIYCGPDFSQEPDYIIGYPVELDSVAFHRFLYNGAYNIGDVDGDGYADLAAMHGVNPLIYRLGWGADTIYDYFLEGNAKRMAAAGDVNGDGYNDVICGRTRTAAGAVDIYLGGDDWDMTPDLSLDRFDLPPAHIIDIGTAVSTAGDFNGDGCDDFMFYCRTDLQEKFGDVFVIEGGDWLPNDVEYDFEPTHPSGFYLDQNYPNPFNAETTIEFDLPRAGDVTLTITNILGQHVRTLITSHLSMGHYSVPWNGQDDAGLEVASGVYLYRLTSGTLAESRKMLLLK
ncbi:MAG: FlgD immunoglobulin-like domain containing protein [bacterium]